MGGVLVRLRDYVFFERNPLVQVRPLMHPENNMIAYLILYYVQILYFAAMGACYYLYLREAHPLLPNEYVDWYHNCSEFTQDSVPILPTVWFNGCVGEKNYKYFLAYLLSNQALGFVTAMCLMTSVILWVFIFMQLRRISQNTTANESFKREDLREEAEIDGETSGRRMFRFLFKRLNFRQRPKLAIPRREQKKALDASWGGLFSPDTIMNTEESFSVDDVNFNPYKLATFRENLLDALQIRRNNKQKTK
ncbi:hypothetical protein BBJ29_002594 [Phytophthora kernoviae]|uniref:Uncharacterized protein n=1 Tax=Phytophthora kernoviae TaxID=325452 RepID=A0A421GB83_9STRA|nr:hypothetical protein BBJ29_002594 [Phytophthora kernoviae]